MNSDSEYIGEVARRYGVSFYKRPKELATSYSMIDDYIYEFLLNVPCDILAVVNPTSPFLTSKEIDEAIDHFLENDFDTMLSCENVRTHCFLNENPINFSTKGKHPRSQDLTPVQALNFAVTVWKAEVYRKNYKEKGYGVYTGKLGFYAFKGFSTIDIDWEEDFSLAEIILENKDKLMAKKPRWDPVLDDIIKSGMETKK